MNTPERILVRGVNWLGDAVMTTPALQRLRQHFPGASITLLTPAKLADLWTGHPSIDEVLPFQPSDSIWSVARRLHPQRFSLAIILPNSVRSALECFVARIPRRTGLARPWRTWLLNQAVPVRSGARSMIKPSPTELRRRLERTEHGPSPFDATAHHTLDYLEIVAALGATSEPCPPVLRVADVEVGDALEKFGANPNTAWLGLNPGAEYGPAKRWPAARFREAAMSVAKKHGCQWLLFGGPKDREITASIAGGLPGALDLAGRTTLRELMALLCACRVVLTNDTGPMHVAAALGVPVVVPFGSTSPELTGPGKPGDARHRLLRGDAACAPCFLRECPLDFRCMTSIDSDRVTEAVTAALRHSALVKPGGRPS